MSRFVLHPKARRICVASASRFQSWDRTKPVRFSPNPKTSSPKPVLQSSVFCSCIFHCGWFDIGGEQGPVLHAQVGLKAPGSDWSVQHRRTAPTAFGKTAMALLFGTCGGSSRAKHRQSGSRLQRLSNDSRSVLEGSQQQLLLHCHGEQCLAFLIMRVEHCILCQLQQTDHVKSVINLDMGRVTPKLALANTLALFSSH